MDEAGLDIKIAVTEGYIKPAADLRINDELQDTYKEGLMFGDQEEILTRGHTAAASTSKDRIQ